MAMLVGSDATRQVERAAGDGPADPFERLFVREYPRVVSIARRVLGERDAAEDVAQDAFVTFARGHDPASRQLDSYALHRITDVALTMNEDGGLSDPVG